MSQKLVTVVLSGGSGTRLWPASRESHPKPFIKLADGETLIQKTYARAKALSADVLTVTNRDYYFMSREELQKVGVAGSFLLEPCGRNTAPAIALAIKYCTDKLGCSGDEVLFISTSDHIIRPMLTFQSAVTKAVNFSREGKFVTFGASHQST